MKKTSNSVLPLILIMLFISSFVFKTEVLAVSTTTVKLSEYTGYLNEYKFIYVQRISEKQALSNCLGNSKTNPNSKIRCVWDGKVIYKTPEVVKKSTYEFYSNGFRLINDKNVTKVNALNSCKAYASRIPNIPVVCKWDGKVIYTNIPPVNPSLGSYVAYLNEFVFNRVDNISKKDAYDNCVSNAKSNPDSKIRCTWNGKDIYKN